MLTKSKHAAVRAQQRGASDQLLSDLIDNADVDHLVGKGCRVLRLSRKALRDSALREKLGATLERLASLALIWSDDTGEVVTVLREHGGKSGRRYRRQYH